MLKSRCITFKLLNLNDKLIWLNFDALCVVGLFSLIQQLKIKFYSSFFKKKACQMTGLFVTATILILRRLNRS